MAGRWLVRVASLCLALAAMGGAAALAQETCEAALDCFGNPTMGEWPNCRCPSCGLDHPCAFPDTPAGTWPDCFCDRPPPVDPTAPFNPCQAACPVGQGTGAWPNCACEPSSACNPLACPPGSDMVGTPPSCFCEPRQMLPPPG
jgi:hypothetical protein